MPSQTFLTVAEAAVRVGKSRQTLFDKIKRGQLSATVNADGNKVIDVSELLRVFGTLLSDEQVQKNQANRAGQPEPSSVTVALQLELELARLRQTHAEKELASANKQLEEMRVRERQSIEDRTQLLGVIERQTLLLAAPKPAPAAREKPAAKAPAKPKTAPVAVVKKPATKVAARTPAKPAAAKKTTTRQAKPAPKPVAKKATRK